MAAISKKEIAWISYLNNPNIESGKTIIINGSRLKPDGLDATTNNWYEFYGDYWHGNPNKFDQNKSRSKYKTYGQVYQTTIDREKRIKAAGYNLITIWEEDFDKLNIQY